MILLLQQSQHSMMEEETGEEGWEDTVTEAGAEETGKAKSR